MDNTIGYEIESFGDYFTGYHQILMIEEDREKIAFITPWETLCYPVIYFDLKNIGTTYQRIITILFYYMIHKEMDIYMDNIINKVKKVEYYLVDLKKLLESLRKYNLKLNLVKCAFRASISELLEFIVNKKGIKIDLVKIKTI